MTAASLDRNAAGRAVTPAARHLLDELDQVVKTGDFVELLRRSEQLGASASGLTEPDGFVDELCRFARRDPLAAIVALEVASHVDGRTVDDLLVTSLDAPHQLIRRHAAWRLARRLPIRRAYQPLLDLLVRGGVTTMHAHRTLRGWAASDAEWIAALVRGRLASVRDSAARARLVDLLGVIPSPTVVEPLVTISTDRTEAAAVRIAALGALGERRTPDVERALRAVAAGDDDVGAHAALALEALGTLPGGDTELAAVVGKETRSDSGLRVAQLVLAGGLDGQLSRGGRGETGGVASLLVSLGQALARRPDVEHVLTIGRGTVTDALTETLGTGDDALSYGMIDIGDDARPATTPDGVWEHLPSIERGVRRALRAAGPIDVLHLRMADAATLAGAEVARAAGIPICFSVAPDPHNVIESLQSRGELDAESFVSLDDETDVWFRARLVERLARDADRLALFPRAEPLQFLGEIGVDDGALAERSAIVAEGIDITSIDRARDGHRPGAHGRSDVLAELEAAIPAERRGLPIVLSVGRLHPVKGMERLVAAWSNDEQLAAASNLVIVGGDLDEPSPTERGVLDAIDRSVAADDPRRRGLVLLGGRPRNDVARLQVATAIGRPGAWAPGGIYVDGALKEEFGLAVIESLAAGLVVVAPSTGGPPTYVVDDDTGVLVDPDGDLASAIRTAFDLVERPGRAERARRMVEERYSIDTMAAQLVELYGRAEALV